MSYLYRATSKRNAPSRESFRGRRFGPRYVLPRRYRQMVPVWTIRPRKFSPAVSR